MVYLPTKLGDFGWDMYGNVDTYSIYMEHIWQIDGLNHWIGFEYHIGLAEMYGHVGCQKHILKKFEEYPICHANL